jgi:hypothetical protein
MVSHQWQALMGCSDQYLGKKPAFCLRKINWEKPPPPDSWDILDSQPGSSQEVLCKLKSTVHRQVEFEV